MRISAVAGTPELVRKNEKTLKESLSGQLDKITGGKSDATATSILRPAHGSLRWLAAEYFSSTEFSSLDPKMQYTWRLIMSSILAEPLAPDSEKTFADYPVMRMTRQAIRVLRDRKMIAGLPEAANGRLKL